uniref:Lin1244/Lin1753-like N-terminal domain-containing protein n=1 Tax=viral metagenome TaxID=1070528 RepID=A0A6M3KAJ4_9ZZZZ
MTRPLKQTVDYFPHYADASERVTIFTLQSKYGNDGYAFWFKILELLAKSEGHYIDYSKASAWQFIVGRTGVNEEKATNILATLADLDAIDKEMAEKKIIWSQNFVDNISDAYKRRQVSLPVRPGSQPVAEPAKKKQGPAPVDTSSILDPDFGACIALWEDNKGLMSPYTLEQLTALYDEYPEGWLLDAIKEAIEQGKLSLAYVKAILKRWQAEGRTSNKPAPFERQEYTLD